MQIASHRVFRLNLVRVRLSHIVRAIASVLAVVLLGNSVAFAADAPKVKTAMAPALLKQELTARGIGKGVKVKELDGTTIVGTLIVIQDDSFQITQNHAVQPMTIQDANVKSIRNSGLSTAAKVGIGIGIGVGGLLGFMLIDLATHPL
jgi:sulfur transfer complex TusBCD TusB component (DsrH family)